MTTSVARAFTLAGAFTTSLVLFACGGETAQETEPAADSATEATVENPSVVATPVTPLGDGTGPIPVTLEPVNESGVEGRATQIPMADSVQMSLMVQGLPKDGEYAAHIHRGTCVSGGEVLLSLNPVKSEGDGLGRSLTTIPASRLSGDEPRFVQVHGSNGVLACGDVHGS